ncbi:MAG: hypothetical protein WAW96_17605 [Alphaproteobacteria bacterium]
MAKLILVLSKWKEENSSTNRRIAKLFEIQKFKIPGSGIRFAIFEGNTARKGTLMKVYIVLIKKGAVYQFLTKLISDHPILKKGFTLKKLLRLPFFSWDEKRKLNELFGGDYSEILTPVINFKYRNGNWKVDEIDVQKGFHQFITKVLKHAGKDGKYPIGSHASTKDIELVEFLMKKEKEVYQEELKEFDDKGLPITQELLKFVLSGLQERLGETSCFDYGLVKALLESLRDYEEILIEREFG